MRVSAVQVPPHNNSIEMNRETVTVSQGDYSCLSHCKHPTIIFSDSHCTDVTHGGAHVPIACPGCGCVCCITSKSVHLPRTSMFGLGQSNSERIAIVNDGITGMEERRSLIRKVRYLSNNEQVRVA